jgi:CheY-like chemotaxis protein
MITPAEILRGKILIVDDRPRNVLLLEQMLRGAGYLSITSTSDPRDVCRLHGESPFDLILLDLQMPGFDGFEVMAGLESIETGGYLPVLVVTAQPDQKLRALRAGARDFVSKPFVLAEVLIRVHNLLEVRLLHAQTGLLYAQARAAIRARDDVLGIVAHDLRSPLSTIITQLELIRRSSPAVARGPIEHLHRAAHHMERLIRDLLDVARLDAGRGLAMDHACVDPLALLGAAVELEQAGARAAGLTLAVAASAAVAPVWADYFRLLQVLDNLIGNAIKFTPAGGSILGRRDGGSGGGGVHRLRHRHGHSPRPPPPRLRAILAGGPRAPPRGWPGARDRQGHRRGARRADLGREHPRCRDDVLVHRARRGARAAGPQDASTAPPSIASPSWWSTTMTSRARPSTTCCEKRATASSKPRTRRSALELFSTHDHAVDLLLTDVRLGAMDGVELAAHVRGIREIPVVFMTGLDATRVAGGVFVPKPINLANLLELVAHELARGDAAPARG